MKINNNIRNLIKIAILIFIILSCIYVLYIFNNEYRIIENLANVRDCSNCTVKPSSGNCVPIYDISYKYIPLGGDRYKLDISNVITNNVFCGWESQCMFDNVTSIDERSALSNRNIGEGINDITCCSGSSFYDNSNINFNYSVIQDNTDNISDCLNIKRYISQPSALSGALDVSRTVLAQTLRICNTLEPSGSLFNKRGMLFSKREASFNIFTDPKSMPRDILNFISFSNIRNGIRAILGGPTPGNLNGFSEISLNNIITQLEQIDDSIATTSNTTQRQLQRSDLTPSQINSLTPILNNLRNGYTSALPNIPLSIRTDISYSLVTNVKNAQNYTPYVPLLGNSYLLNPEQFFNCMGEVKTDFSGSFTADQLADFSNNDYFGTSGQPISLGGLGDASYSALGSLRDTSYPSNNDLEMELRRLETIPSSGNAPVSVITSYLSAINSFYEKQLQNISGPREHTYNQQMVFDNNSIQTTAPTFFTYNKDENNVYDCQESITGNSTFKYCGPEAYYEIPNF